MHRLRGTAWIVVAASLAACSSGPQDNYATQVLVAPAGPLVRDREVVIRVPADGSIRDAVYYGSGRKSADALQRAFAAFTSKVSVVACPPDACDRGAGYFVVPQILSWEDRVTGWSGNRDRVTLKITVFDAATGKPLSSHVVLAAGTLMVRLSDDLLPATTNRFVGSLY